MKKILIIGSSGSGKTTFAKELSKILNIPVIHLDKLFWCGEWEHISRDEFDKLLQVELEKSEWIIDGNFGRTIPHRLKYCDTVFYFDLPTITCLWGSTVRVVKNYGKSRDDMGGNCPEYFDKQKVSLYKAIFSFNRTHRKKYRKLLGEQKNKNVVIFKSRKQVKRYLKNYNAYHQRKALVKSYLGKTVDIKIDRPIGYVHRKENYSLTYPINYGYIPGVIGGDGEELDVYLLGVDKPVTEYSAKIIGIAHRENDVEDKLIAAPISLNFTKEEIEQAIHFQEQYYKTAVEVFK